MSIKKFACCMSGPNEAGNTLAGSKRGNGMSGQMYLDGLVRTSSCMYVKSVS